MKMDEELQDYEENDDSLLIVECNNIQEKNDGIFPEVWELEMEILQLENRLDGNANMSCDGTQVQQDNLLEDYIDSDDDLQICMKITNPEIEINRENSFPPMWDLELEILQCENVKSNNFSLVEHGEFTLNESNVKSVCTSIESSCQYTLSPTMFHNEIEKENEDIFTASLMLNELNISGIIDKKDDHLDVQSELANIRI